MPTVSLHNTKGQTLGDITLAEEIFGAEINESLMHAAIVKYLAAQRQGTAKTKTRGEVRGGGRKPWRQKGTGRARAGTIRSPIWVGGGTTFGPTPRDYTQKMNKKAKRKALCSALSAKVKNGNLVVVDQFSFATPKTKEMIGILDNLNANAKALIVTEAVERNVIKSANNIPGVKTTFANVINVYDVLNAEFVILTEAAVRKVEEVFA